MPRRGTLSSGAAFPLAHISPHFLRELALPRNGWRHSKPILCGTCCGAILMSSNSLSGLDLRGQTYYLRIRVPKEYADVDPRVEIHRSLRTRDRLQAEVLCVNAKLALREEWEAKRSARAVDLRTCFDASRKLLSSWGLPFSPMEDLISGPVDDLLKRIEKLANVDLQSPIVPAVLGALDLPDQALADMAKRMPILKDAEIPAKNARQRREWCGNFERAARDFTQQIGSRTILSISEQDAVDYEDFWRKRARSNEVSANYANKQIRYVRQMVDAHFNDIRLPKSRRCNPFQNMKVTQLSYDQAGEERKKLPLPEKWVHERLIRDRALEGFNPQASDIAIVAAVCGCRFSEIYDLPPEDIHLDHEIPHFRIRFLIDGPDRREIKNSPSTRMVALLGPALEAMRRNPLGFPQYRGKASFSGGVNGYLRDNAIFPSLPEGVSGRYVISGMRHSFEDRLRAAKVDNEERAFLMGHSVGKVRGRPVYGSDLDLPIRALLQEMVTFETPSWQSRPIVDLWGEIDRILERGGFRTS